MRRDEIRPDARILSAVARAATDAIIVTVPDGTIVEFNEAAERIFGRTRDEVIGRTMIDLLVPPALQESHRAAVARHRANPGKLSGIMRFTTLAQRGDGSTVSVDVSLATVRGEDASNEMVVSFIRDRTDAQRDIRAEIRTHSDVPDNVADLLTAAPVIVFSLDKSGLIEIFAGGGHTRIGSRDAAAIGRRVYAISPNPDEWDTIFQRAVAGEQFRAIIEVGGQVWDTHFHPVHDEAGQPTGSLAIGVDATSQLVSEHALRVLAETDTMTGLSNRRHVEGRMAELLAADHILALLLVDLDDFKDINDSHGHAVGDSVLAVLGKRLAATVPTGSALGRLGGDELVIGLPTDDLDEITAVAEAVLAAVATPIHVDEQRSGAGIPIDVSITASIGIAVAPVDGDTVPMLLTRADSAMYAAKHSGRATLRYYEVSADFARRRLEVSTRLRGAVAARAVDVEFQPLVRLSDESFIGFEALARWTDPDLGTVSPDEFIALASASPLIDDLFDVVLEKSLDAARAWNDTDPTPRVLGGSALTIWLNVAARQLRDPRLADKIIAAAEAAGVPASWLVLELTETALMEGPARTPAVLTALHDAGIRVAIDDFGIGYSNMARLSTLSASGSVATVKIDRTFVADLPDERATMLLKTIVGLIHSLGMMAVAEGIETAEQLAVIRGLGCEFGQGYYFARPVPLTEALRLRIDH